MTMTVLDEISNLQNSAKNRQLAVTHGLSITTVAWEDTARNKNSCIGPNISDVTLNSHDRRMPMIRKPNFSDVTADVDISLFHVTVGNERSTDSESKRIPLKEYLENLTEYAGAVSSANSMIKERDQAILCSAQACVLPLEETGEVAFVPQIFNYQSTADDPAVLVVVATSQGTSAHLVTEYAQKLYFNRHGQATEFLAKRLSQDRAERNVAVKGDMSQEEQDRNVLVMYQIPLKKKNPYRNWTDGSLVFAGGVGIAEQCFLTQPLGCARGGARRKKGMEHAMLRSSDVSKGSFRSLANVTFERDDRFPIRATFQFYRVTDDSDITEEIFADIADKIESVYKMATDKGSLVIDTTSRITEKGAKLPPLKELAAVPTDAPALFSGFKEKQEKQEQNQDFVLVE